MQGWEMEAAECKWKQLFGKLGSHAFVSCLLEHLHAEALIGKGTFCSAHVSSVLRGTAL